MAHVQDLLRKGKVVRKEGKRNAFEKISDLVAEWERATFPNNGQLSMHKSAYCSGNRLKLICHLNKSNVAEGDRVCDFKLIATTSDGNASATVSKNVCLSHSCQTEAFKNSRGGPSGQITTKRDCLAPVVTVRPDGENVYLVGSKKRKFEEQQDNYKEAWKLINSQKMFAEDCFDKKSAYLEEIGVYEARELRDLEGDHIETLGALLKEMPRKRWTKLLA